MLQSPEVKSCCLRPGTSCIENPPPHFFLKKMNLKKNSGSYQVFNSFITHPMCTPLPPLCPLTTPMYGPPLVGGSVNLVSRQGGY